MMNGLFVLDGTTLLGITPKTPAANASYTYFDRGDGQFVTNVTAAAGQAVTLAVYDAQGRRVASAAHQVPAGTTAIRTGAAGLAQGLYIVEVDGQGWRKSTKVAVR
jgi:hypothetical protein